MKNNKGFSLIELIIVLAIIAVLGGVMWMGFQSVGSRQVNQCTNNIESFLGRTKTLALAKDAAKVRIYRNDDGYYADIYVGSAAAPETTKKIGTDSLAVSYVTNDSAVTAFSVGTQLELSFQRDSGAFTALGGGSTGVYCVEIQVIKGDYERSVKMIPETGKYFVE